MIYELFDLYTNLQKYSSAEVTQISDPHIKVLYVAYDLHCKIRNFYNKMFSLLTKFNNWGII